MKILHGFRVCPGKLRIMRPRFSMLESIKDFRNFAMTNCPTILHAIDTTGPGGAETVFLDLAEKLHINGYSNYAIIKGSGWVEEQLKKRGIRYYIVKPGGFLSIPYYWSLFTLLRKNKTALIQAHLLGSTLTYSILGFLTRIPLVATIHGQVDVNPNEKWVWVKQKIMRAGVNQLVAVSRDLRDYIEKRKLFPSKRVKVIYNGIDEKKYCVDNSGRLRQELGLPQNSLLIGSLGNVRPAKNYSFLLDIAAELFKDPSLNIRFVIAGHQKKDLMAELEQKMQSLGLQSKVHFIGFQNDTAEYLRQLDIFLLTSLSEGFSIATIEAMASELPVIATRCGGPEEILREPSTGILLDKYDAADAAEKIHELCENPSLRKYLAASGKEFAIENFSADNMYSDYRTIYSQFL
jgi:glycosyltransferase involved in cell wall biosynthesis